MIKKSYAKSGKSARVTFKFVPVDEAEQITVLGDFNEWSPEATPLKKRKDGSFSTTVQLDAGQDYRFRYLLDGRIWENDEESDDLVLNRFGSQDGVISV